MKKLYFIGLLSVMILFFAGCKDKNQPQTFIGSVERPAWEAPNENDMTTSMTAVVKVDLLNQYPERAKDYELNENDLLGAFAGETCLGIASPQEGLFFLYVDGTEGSVTLRYYSAHYKNLFEAKDAFEFKNDDHLGTVSEPYKPVFTVVE